jgi:hypothetical protein
MTNAYALKTAKELNAIVASDPAQAPAILAYLNEAIAAGKRRTRPSRMLQAKLAGSPTAPAKPAKRAKARKAQPEAKAAPAASQDALVGKALEAFDKTMASARDDFAANFISLL